MSRQTSRPSTKSSNRALGLVFNRNGVRINVAGKPRFWVKYGNDSRIRGEGRTQAYVAGIVNADSASVFRVPNVYLGFSCEKQGYIVMDFVEGTTVAQRKLDGGRYKTRDIKAVAAVVKQLTNIKVPADTHPPGPIGGGPIGHDFFFGFFSKLVYSTAEI